MDWEERVQVIYAGDSAADEIAMEVLKGVAYTYKVDDKKSTKRLSGFKPMDKE